MRTKPNPFAPPKPAPGSFVTPAFERWYREERRANKKRPESDQMEFDFDNKNDDADTLAAPLATLQDQKIDSTDPAYTKLFRLWAKELEAKKVGS